MSEDEEDDVAVAAEYVLGLLTPEEARAFEGRMDVDPAFRDLVASWTERFAGLAEAIPEVRPPVGTEAALMRRLFPEEQKSLWRRLGVLPALLGGLAAALIVVWTTDLGLLRGGPPGPVYEARIAAEDASLVVLARFDAATGLLAVERVEGAVAPGRAQELWLIAGDATPVSLGMLPAEGDGSLVVEASLAATIEGAVLAITDEAPGGALPGAAPGAVIALGPVTRS